MPLVTTQWTPNVLGWLKRPLPTQTSDFIWKNLQPNVVGITCIFLMGILFSAMSWEFFQACFYYFCLLFNYLCPNRKSCHLWHPIFSPLGYGRLCKQELFGMITVWNLCSQMQLGSPVYFWWGCLGSSFFTNIFGTYHIFRQFSIIFSRQSFEFKDH